MRRNRDGQSPVISSGGAPQSLSQIGRLLLSASRGAPQVGALARGLSARSGPCLESAAVFFGHFGADERVDWLHTRAAEMEHAPDTVIVIDDDRDVRDALGRLLRSVGLQVRLHGSVPDFLGAGPPGGPACLVLDVRLPGQSGLDLQRELVNSGVHLPIIFITGHGDIAMSVQAMKGGPIEFLTKRQRSASTPLPIASTTSCRC